MTDKNAQSAKRATAKKGTAKKATAKKATAKKGTAKKATAERRRRTQLAQADVPAHALQEALRVAQTLRDAYASRPTEPRLVATAMDMGVGGSTFKMLTGAAAAYGLTEGAAQAEQIALTPLGRRVVAPTEEGDDARAMREAVLQPRVVGEFLRRYNNSPLPPPHIGQNVLETMGVPPEATERAWTLIIQNAEALGLITQVGSQTVVNLDDLATVSTPDEPVAVSEDVSEGQGPADAPTLDGPYDVENAPPLTAAGVNPATNNRVFVTHGSNKEIVEQIKEIMTFGKFEPVVSVEKESVAKPVPDKVLDDMRTCFAGIVHVGSERRVVDQEGVEHVILNPNVLIEIGAAMALYHRRFILLVERGVTLPSNLQGLYEVRYEGEKLDYDATMKLLKAFNEFLES